MKRFFFLFLLASAASTQGAATRNDWKVFPMTESKVQIPLDLVYDGVMYDGVRPDIRTFGNKIERFEHAPLCTIA
ncbi:MAG: hypothetical protein KBC64_01480 [Simkaniaceae bacterium]|nr:hypothetical protein [Simkaniaceae bacterium]